MKKIYIIYFLGALLMASCENLIEVDDPTNQLSTSQVFEDTRTANAALTGLYASLRDRSVLTGGGYIGIGPLLASYADDLDCYYYDQNGVVDLSRNLQQETNSTIESIWKTTYQQIYYANAIIYGVQHSTALSDEDKNILQGEAILLRSLLYYYLQELFGDIPYTASTDYEYNRNLAKTTNEKILSQLVTDLKEAITYLSDDYRNAERIYPNRKVAELLLARIYLIQEEWGLAEQTASDILQSPLYQFQNDIQEVFHKSGSHILWQLKPKNNGDATSEATFYYFTDAAPNSYTLTDDLVNTFSDDDLRKQFWMTPVSFNDEFWYRPNKYRNLAGTNTDEYSVVFRLAEVYFIMAESLIKQSRYDEALPYLNATMERAGLPAFTSLSEDAVLTELLAEKRREFFTEFGHRFFDLKRLGQLDELRATKPNWEDYKSVWPLPQSELLLNTNLLPQNSNY
ncbi:RagB/SusD family nutrient uptake outer membrane protein [uncultured Draconibacterium sp.]|uniref:RagB/SusD family nutrient uptake outer membrane protein n=1 Tax=uncultured Draconibacterium sp. TaxID=1573823 RepID=UPI002AA670EC|nr:RagB/SusD family nutrient uptake outer membrane protein [uncultured Draconibacterium sp.]